MKKLSLILVLFMVGCNTSENEIEQLPTLSENCDCEKYNITITRTPEPNSVTTEEVIEEPWCGEETPYRIFIGSNNAYSYQTRIDVYYEIKCGANKY